MVIVAYHDGSVRSETVVLVPTETMEHVYKFQDLLHSHTGYTK